MRIVFMGTPDFAVPSLECLISAGHEVCGVFSQPDKPCLLYTSHLWAQDLLRAGHGQ